MPVDGLTAPEGELPPGMITADQETLLRILYSPDAVAAPMFQEWQARVDMTDLDDGCYRLYPYLYRRIREFAPDHPFLGRLKGLFRRSLYRNNMLFQWAQEVLERLGSAGIDCIVLKGAALVRSIGLSAGFRPMADVDLLVRPGDARRAMEVADPLFRRVLDDPVATLASIQLRHGTSVMDGRRLEIDLHWRIGDVWAPGDDPDAPFWETAQPIRLSGARALALAPTELLYHVVVHGLSWNALPTVRWISDALDIMAAEADLLDWRRLVALAERYHQRATVRVGLSYVRHRFGGAVPDWVLEALGPPYDAREAADFRQEMLPWKTPVDMADVRLLAPGWLVRVRERVPGRRCIVLLPDTMATADTMGWIASIGADHICEFPADGAVMAEVRRHVLGSEQWRRGFYGRPGALLQLDLPAVLPLGLSGPVYVRVWRNEQGQWRTRAFVTSLKDWPIGAYVLRLDSVVGFRKPSLLGRDDAVPTPCLPAWPGFPKGALTPTPAAGSASPVAR